MKRLVAARTSEPAAEAPSPTRTIRVRTDDWPERDRVTMFRENVGRDRVRVEPLASEPFRIDAIIIKAPDLGLVWGRRSALRSDFADGSDRLVFNLGAASVACHAGREHVLKAGDAVAFCGSDVGSLTTLHAGVIGTIEFPSGSLHRLLRDPAASYARPVPMGSPALRLLRSYVRSLVSSGGLAQPAVQHLAVAHVHDLALLALGTNGGEAATNRGVRAARLESIKSDILARLEHEVTLNDVAARQQLSPRYIRMLFAGEATTFTDFVRDARLDRARRMLLNPAFNARRISEIAYEVGFNDLSYFNRTFRRRFGKTPGGTRAGD